MHFKTLLLKSRFLLPLICLLIIITGGLGGVILQQQNIKIKTSSNYVSNIAIDVYNGILNEQSNAINGFQQVLLTDSIFQNDFTRIKREHIIEKYQSIFGKLKATYDITHLSLYDREGTNYVRIHNRDKFGDKIDNFTMNEAMITGEITSGIKLESSGTPTLRVVSPIFIHGELIGYIETGKNIEYIFNAIHQYTGNDLTVTINKEYIDKDKWLNDLIIFNRKGDWEKYTESVPVYSTMETIPENISRDISEIINSGTIALFNINNKKINVIPLELKNRSNNVIGNIILFHDITKVVRNRNILGGVIVLSDLILLTFLLLFLFNIQDSSERFIWNKRLPSSSGINISTLISTIPGNIYLKDNNHNYIAVNKSFSNMTGIKQEEIHNKCDFDLFSRKQAQKYGIDDSIFLKSGEPVNNEIKEIVDSTGNFFWAEINKNPIYRDNKIVGVVGIIRDISRLKEKELIIEEKYNKLKKEKEKADATSNAKSEFLANMSHDIRTPMNAIIGFTNVLIKNEKDKKKLAKLENVKKAGNNLLDLINDILDLSKIEANKIELDLVPFSPSNMLYQLGELYSILAQKKKIDFIVHISDNIPDILVGDPRKIRQIINNILGNALKFTTKGFVKFDALYADESLVVLISDSGIGISMELTDKIFDPFQQGDPSSKRQFQGTGLGLAISKKFLELMRGSIVVDSQKNIGSLFKITIPLPDAEKNYIYGSEEFSTASKIGENQNTHCNEIVQNWINNCNGNQKVIDILLKAIKELPDKVEILENAIRCSNNQEIDFISHDLKGIWSNLGMTELYTDANIINKEIRNKNPNFNFIIERCSRLNSFVSNISQEFVNRNINFQTDKTLYSDYPQILTVDDNELNRELIITFLQEINIGTDISSSGKETLEKIKNKRYDILLLDICMPEMSGEEVVLEIRKNREYNDLYVIAVTANAMKGDAKKYIDIGCNHYLSKPVDHEKLNNTILNLIAAHKSPRSKTDSAKSYDLAKLSHGEYKQVSLILQSLESNLEIFYPDQIISMITGLEAISTNKTILDMTNKLKSIVKDIDEEELETFFKKIIYPD